MTDEAQKPSESDASGSAVSVRPTPPLTLEREADPPATTAIQRLIKLIAA